MHGGQDHAPRGEHVVRAHLGRLVPAPRGERGEPHAAPEALADAHRHLHGLHAIRGVFIGLGRFEVVLPILLRGADTRVREPHAEDPIPASVRGDPLRLEELLEGVRQPLRALAAAVRREPDGRADGPGEGFDALPDHVVRDGAPPIRRQAAPGLVEHPPPLLRAEPLRERPPRDDRADLRAREERLRAGRDDAARDLREDQRDLIPPERRRVSREDGEVTRGGGLVLRERGGDLVRDLPALLPLVRSGQEPDDTRERPAVAGRLGHRAECVVLTLHEDVPRLHDLAPRTVVVHHGEDRGAEADRRFREELGRRSAPAVDRLPAVADDEEAPATVLGQELRDPELDEVVVLRLVDEDVARGVHRPPLQGREPRGQDVREVVGPEALLRGDVELPRLPPAWRRDLTRLRAALHVRQYRRIVRVLERERPDLVVDVARPVGQLHVRGDVRPVRVVEEPESWQLRAGHDGRGQRRVSARQGVAGLAPVRTLPLEDRLPDLPVRGQVHIPLSGIQETPVREPGREDPLHDAHRERVHRPDPGVRERTWGQKRPDAVPELVGGLPGEGGHHDLTRRHAGLHQRGVGGREECGFPAPRAGCDHAHGVRLRGQDPRDGALLARVQARERGVGADLRGFPVRGRLGHLRSVIPAGGRGAGCPGPGLGAPGQPGHVQGATAGVRVVRPPLRTAQEVTPRARPLSHGGPAPGAWREVLHRISER